MKPASQFGTFGVLAAGFFRYEEIIDVGQAIAATESRKLPAHSWHRFPPLGSV